MLKKKAVKYTLISVVSLTSAYGLYEATKRGVKLLGSISWSSKKDYLKRVQADARKLQAKPNAEKTDADRSMLENYRAVLARHGATIQTDLNNNHATPAV